MFSLFKEVIGEFSRDRCTRMAAALAYYTVFSLAPLLLIIMGICGLFLEAQAVQGELDQQLVAMLGADGAQQVRTMLSNVDKPGRGLLATLLGTAALLLGATGVVGQLQDALNETWGVTPDPTRSSVLRILTKRLLSFAMVLSLGFLLLVSLIFTAVIEAFGDMLAERWLGAAAVVLIEVLNFSLSLLMITLLLAAIFKVLPMAKIAWADVWVGAFGTALLFLGGKFAIGMYLGSQNVESSYGAAGSLVLILLWIYYSAMILLLGAEFTQVWTKRRGRSIEPERGAVKFKRELLTQA